MPSSGPEVRLETAKVDLTRPAGPELAQRAAARALLREGQGERAFAELVRSARERPMGGRMAHALVGLGLATGKVGPVLTLVSQGVDEAEGPERIGVMRALARLQRRTGQDQAAVETLSMLLAEAPEDRRARLVLNALLERFERFDELDASLDKETRLLLRRRYFRAASRIAVRRARLWGERRGEPARAALRYAQACQYAEQGQDPHSVFLLRLLWLRALVHAEAPTRSIDEGVRTVLEVAARVGREHRARAFLRELNVRVPHAPLAPELELTVSIVTTPAQREKPPPPVPEPEPEADAPVRGQVEEALLVAAASAPAASSRALSQLEARYVARGAWRELARFYRATADARAEPADRVTWLEKLAEVLESELDDAAGAAAVWAEVAQLTGDAQAVSEQVRLHDQRDDGAAVKQALDAGVGRAQDPKEKSRLLVLRAQEARSRGDTDRARADLEEALRTSPASLEAAAGLAELAATRGELGPLRHFEKLLLAAPKRLPERGALFRRLARAADDTRDPRLALVAWGEVLSTAPHDDEAMGRLAVLALALSDESTLENVLRQVLAKDPRGERAREAWLDLVAYLERTGRGDEALGALREAVKVEPGHLRAWLVLVDRLIARQLDAEAADALEQAAHSAPEGPERTSIWRRLVRHARERLADDDRAEKYEERIERARAQPPAPAKLPGGPLVVPSPKNKSKAPSPVARETVSDDEESDAFANALGSQRELESSRPPPAPRLPARLQRVLDPIVAEFTNRTETREQPALKFADDDDVDDVVEAQRPAAVDLEATRAIDEPSVVVADEAFASVLAPEPVTASELSPRATPRHDDDQPTMPVKPPLARPERPKRDAGADAEPSSKSRALESSAAEPSSRSRALEVEPSSKRRALAPADVEPDVEPSSKGRALAPSDVEPSSRGRALEVEASKKGRALDSSAEPPSQGRALASAHVEPSSRGRALEVEASKKGRALDSSEAEPSSKGRAVAPSDVEPSSRGRAVEVEASKKGRALEPADAGPSENRASSDADPTSRPSSASRRSLPAVANDSASRAAKPVDGLGADDEETVHHQPRAPMRERHLAEERERLFERVRLKPLDPDGYRMLAEHFDTADDAERSQLMLELARALEGDPNAAPRPPRLMLSATDRASLRHPLLRTEPAELVTLASPALCRLFPPKGKDAQASEAFALEAGKGAKPAADALLSAVRVLGMRAPDVFVTDEPGPPFSALQSSPPKLVVTRMAVKRPLADAELRFYAGRALFTLSGELLALRTLKRDQLRAGLDAVALVLKGQVSTEARLLREVLPSKSIERLKALWPSASKALDLSALMEGARHSANRAGLVVCGGIAPVIASLRAKKALPVEVTELVRFAASDRYLQVRGRKLGS